MKIIKLNRKFPTTKFGLILALLFICSHTLLAQTLDANRTTGTKIADLLNKFPAENSTTLNSALKEISTFEPQELSQMILMLTEDGNNEKLEFALSGFSFYVSQESEDELSNKAVEAFGQSLDKIGFDEGKAFVIENLRIVGNDNAVPFLTPYLNDERLGSPASRAMASINTATSEKALIAALNEAESDDNRLHLIEALGDIKSKAAAVLIEPFVNSNDPNVKKVAIYSLANIGALSSEKVLAEAAESANYKYEETNATSEFLKYIKNLSQEGETKTALSLAKKIHKNTSEQDQFHTKIGALNLMVSLDPGKSAKLLQKAALSPSAAYRSSALDLALNGDLANQLESWSKLLGKAEDPVKVDIIRTLGRLQGDAVLEVIRPYLHSSNSAVKNQAIASAVSVGENKVLEDFLGMISTSNEEEIEAIKMALLTMDGQDISDQVANALPEASDEAKVALTEVLAARPSAAHMDVVLEEVASNNNEVKNAALSALSSLAAPSHLDKLVALLTTHQHPEELKLIQRAIIAANAQQVNKSHQTSWALETLKTLPDDKQVYLYDVLAHTGGSAALSSLSDIYQTGNVGQKKAALVAIANWSDAEAMEVLFDIAENDVNEDYSNQALEGYINLIKTTSHQPEGKVLLLRKALEIAKSDKNKQLILTNLTQYPTFQGLLVAGRHLDDPGVQQEAARAVMGIALADTSLYGDEVREIVQKTIEVISGQDSEYYKTSLEKLLDEMPKGKGFYSIFNGQNLEGWKGLVANPVKRASMSPSALAKEQEKANQEMLTGWEVRDGLLVFTGKGNNLVTENKYGDFEMLVDWKITKDGDAGIYLRGTPQVQIWDISRVDVGAEVGSGGLYNNQKHPSKPLKVADNPVGEWNTFHIIMKGDQVTVHLNGELVVDEVVLENYWDRSIPIFPEEQIELQAHGTYVAYRDIYIKELPRQEVFQLSEEEKKEGFEVLFDGSNLNHWTGNTTDYVVEDGAIVIYPDRGGKGNLFTKREYGDFVFRFEFKLTPGANNGLGIRAPLEGDAAYEGMELQILDNTADIYKNLQEYQFHGSLYGIAAAKKGYLKPVGEWNYQEVRVKGDNIQVELNGTLILDTDISGPRENGTKDGREHPGLKRDSGHIGFLGHGDVVYFRNIRIKDLNE
jgi:HEAT repeat protein